ncbi:MAG: glutamate synthase large subunit [Gammaproteobacteria bacterium]
MDNFSFPTKQGLYDPKNEHDSCGVGFIANIKNTKSHHIIHQGLAILSNLVHRGAVGADPSAGDGAGILLQIPDEFMRIEAMSLGITLPPAGEYGIGMMFLPKDEAIRKSCEQAVVQAITKEGQQILGWRDVPTDNAHLGAAVKHMEPTIRQVFIGRSKNIQDVDTFERKLFVIRKQAHHIIWDHPYASKIRFYIPSMSARTLCYKGMILPNKLASYYADLQNTEMKSAFALVHQRFSTNTFPSWELAQPLRYLCHNGEINTLQGNINWMRARRHNMHSDLLGEDLAKLWPLIGDSNSDSATFDNALELLLAGGYSLTQAMMLMIPEAWDKKTTMDPQRRAYYEYHAALMEPWDGPAFVAFTDGRQIGATLDRNGLRPGRYIVTDDDTVIMASESGVLNIAPEKIVQQWRLQPGKMFLIDLEQGRIIHDDELKSAYISAHPYPQWLAQTQIKLEQLPAEPEPASQPTQHDNLLPQQIAFGYTQEDIKFFLEPMALNGLDPIDSMGRDTPIAVLSQRSKLLYDYFKQRFAEVTNPAIDPIREELVMSLTTFIGPRPNLFDLNSAGQHIRLVAKRPILSNIDLEKIRHIHNKVDLPFRTATISICCPLQDGSVDMAQALTQICQQAQKQVAAGYNILILSDRGLNAEQLAIPALLATAATHHHLINIGLRTEVGLVIETGEARQVHDFCLLAGYGAETINPYLALQTLSELRSPLTQKISEENLHQQYINAVNTGMLKVMSKMGISTYQSYCGAQIFDAVGLSQSFIDKYFVGTRSAIEGIGLVEVTQETLHRHRDAFNSRHTQSLPASGDLSYLVHGEKHMWTPETITLLQHAIRREDYDKYREFSELTNSKYRELMTLRGLFEFKQAAQAIPLAEVEPITQIMKRFVTGAMSFGSISAESHNTLAIAMNRIGGKSNTGEGGEEVERYTPEPNGDSKRSAIKQIASGRFGVTTEYLINADEIQIKIAQGAKPGEGGQLPGHKVDHIIAKVRHSTPGVGLISPPPHHDIYSIEDLAQLIYDLKNVNPNARISVKLVAEIGVGTIAAGVAKARADHILISGFEGGTGASPITSLHHAGSPWELGLAETQQTLLLNKLRTRIVLQTDGGLRTGRDVAIAALLGADEFGFGTAALITQGCLMMRKCHLNTCPVGIATQNSTLRERFTGEAEHLINYFSFIAQELRELMAGLGFRTVKEMIGRVDKLNIRTAIDHWKAQKLDLSPILHAPDTKTARHHCEQQDHSLQEIADLELIKQAQAALTKASPITIKRTINNTDRAFGTMLSGKIAKQYGDQGLPENTITIKLQGTAGQSFGAFLAHGVTLELAGDANDYVGKGLSGGRIMIYPPEASKLDPSKTIMAGNTLLYGAVRGECFICGVAGERFAVRNSGATAVVEGIGDHGCEYMTGGIVVVLGETGCNFAAGMSGGIAYVLDQHEHFEQYCNTTMVNIERIHPDPPLPKHMNEQQALQDLLNFDALRLRHLIEKHLHTTNSQRAADILKRWHTYLPKFIKVMPKDYQRVLQQSHDQTNANTVLSGT